MLRLRVIEMQIRFLKSSCNNEIILLIMKQSHRYKELLKNILFFTLNKQRIILLCLTKKQVSPTKCLTLRFPYVR